MNVVVPNIPGPNMDKKFQFCGIDLKDNPPTESL
jgi:hypothetical protein